jgi:hypothetical protein
MKRVTGIGGVFIKANDPAALGAWYKRHLGIDVQDWGGAAFTWADSDGKPVGGTTAWSVGDGSNFAPSNASFIWHISAARLRQLNATPFARSLSCSYSRSASVSKRGTSGAFRLPGNRQGAAS